MQFNQKQAESKLQQMQANLDKGTRDAGWSKDGSFTIELRDTGDFGFVLPPDQIRGTVEEQWEGQQVLWSLLDEEFFDGEGPAIYTGM